MSLLYPHIHLGTNVFLQYYYLPVFCKYLVDKLFLSSFVKLFEVDLFCLCTLYYD